MKYKLVLFVLLLLSQLAFAIDVDNCTDLNNMFSNLSASYEQTQDINCFTDTREGGALWDNGQGFSPVGISAAFTGNLNGNNYTISHLHINRPDSQYVGLIGFGTGGNLVNLRLTDVNIFGGPYTGGLLGINDSGLTMTNVTVSGDVNGTSRVGLIVGGAPTGSNITDCNATGTVNGINNIGGVAGELNQLDMDNCHADVNVTGASYVGGLVGTFEPGTLTDSSATGNVTATGQRVGGLVGSGWSQLSIYNSFATGDVTGASTLGGLVGEGPKYLEKSYATGNATATGSYVGGLTGYAQVTIVSSYSTGNVTGLDRVGGLIGHAVDGSSITNSFSTGDVNGNNYVGGFAGMNAEGGGPITNSFSTGTVTGQDCAGNYGDSCGCFVGTVAHEGVITGDYCNDTTGTYSCYGNVTDDGVVNSCNTIDNNIYYFYYSESPPMQGWDFDADWIIAGFPHLRNLENTAKITSCAQLQLMDANLTLDYALQNDLNCEETTRWNNGKGFLPVAPNFNGTLDGNNFTITGLFINRDTNSKVGLIGEGINGVDINNLTLTDVNIIGGNWTGALIGGHTSDLMINNCSVSGTVSGSINTGGLVGNATEGVDINSSNMTGTVTGTSIVGGLAGTLEGGGDVNNSYSDTNVTGTSSNAGGLIGLMLAVNVANSYATGAVSGVDVVGGLIGNLTVGTIFYSYATGNINGVDEVGGLTGYANELIIQSYATGDVTGNTNVGGLAGYANTGPSNSYATGNVTGALYVGGLIGHLWAEIGVLNSYATGNVVGNNSGGFVGWNAEGGGTVTNSFSTGSVSGATSGGFVGSNRHDAIIASGYYNNHSGNPSACFGENIMDGTITLCQGIDNNQNYFFDSAQVPLSNWDFSTVWSSTCEDEGYPTLQFQGISNVTQCRAYNTNPDVNLTQIDGSADSTGLPIYSYLNDGNLTITFNAMDSNADDSLTVDINYSTSAAQGSGTVIIDNLSLSAAVCGDADFTNVTACTWDWNILGISDGNYYITTFISDGVDSKFNSSERTVGIDATAPDVNVVSVGGVLANITPPKFAYALDQNIVIAFSVMDQVGGSLVADINYSTQDVQGTGFSIVDNLSLSADVCDGSNFENATACSWQWNLESVTADKYYIIIAVSDGALTGTNASLKLAQIYSPLTGYGQAFCGDNSCNGRETAVTCAADCSPVCGDRACTGTESIFTCPLDCFGCGDNICSTTETYATCPTDCEPVCGDNICAKNENCLTCANDCGTCLNQDIILDQTFDEPATDEEIEDILEESGIEKSAEEVKEIAGKLELERVVKVKQAEVTVGTTDYKTTIIVRAKNKSTKALRKVRIVEVIPKEVAKSASLIKSDIEFRVIKEDPVIEFTIANIEPGQTVEVFYFVEAKVEEAALAGWKPPIPVEATEAIPRPVFCTTNSDCDDSNPCTNEQCIEGECGFIPVPDKTSCGFGMICNQAICEEIERVQLAEEQDLTMIYAAIAILLILGAAAYYYKKL